MQSKIMNKKNNSKLSFPPRKTQQSVTQTCFWLGKHCLVSNVCHSVFSAINRGGLVSLTVYCRALFYV